MNAVCGSLNVSSYLVATEVRTEAVFIGSAGVNTFARSKFAKSVDHSFTRHIHEVQRQLAERQRALFLSTYTFKTLSTTCLPNRRKPRLAAARDDSRPARAAER